jgi:hypothetical protein
VHPTAGIVILSLSGAAALAVGLVLRPRLSPHVVDALMALAGAGLGIGGLCFVDDVDKASWVAAPLILAVVAPAQVRALFADGGPFRT